MYNLEELNRKEKEELLSIAKDLGIKNAEKMDDLTLRLTIIDEQATNFASTAAATEKSGRKRSRVSMLTAFILPIRTRQRRLTRP